MKSQTMRNKKQLVKLFTVVALALTSLSLTACGQRVALEAPEERVKDSTQY